MCHRMAKLAEMEKIKMVAVKTDRRIATAMMEVHANVKQESYVCCDRVNNKGCRMVERQPWSHHCP